MHGEEAGASADAGYQGVDKSEYMQGIQAHWLFAPSNLWMVRRHLMAGQG